MTGREPERPVNAPPASGARTEAPRKPYARPALLAYGGIWELTRQANDFPPFDAFAGSFQTT